MPHVFKISHQTKNDWLRTGCLDVTEYGYTLQSGRNAFKPSLKLTYKQADGLLDALKVLTEYGYLSIRGSIKRYIDFLS